MYQLLCCGSNGSGQLGVGDTDDHSVVQRARLGDDGEDFTTSSAPVRISCGGNHTLVLLKSHEVFAAGSSENGQLGLPEQQISKFKKLDGSWKLVACGWEFSIFVSVDNKLYVSGLGLKGELGLGRKQTRAEELTPIGFTFPDEIVDVQSSMNHTVVQLANGDFYGWGVSRKGQLGVTDEKIIWTPTKLEWGHAKIEGVRGFSVGKDFTVLYGESGVMFSGTQNKIQASLAELAGYSSAQVLAMWTSIHILGENGLASYGNNSHGQLFPKETHLPFLKYAVGSEHGLALSGNGVYAWGWGEHGNCGEYSEGQNRDDVTFDFLNRIYEGENCVDISGGCATSWIVTTV